MSMNEEITCAIERGIKEFLGVMTIYPKTESVSHLDDDHEIVWTGDFVIESFRGTFVAHATVQNPNTKPTRKHLTLLDITIDGKEYAIYG